MLYCCFHHVEQNVNKRAHAFFIEMEELLFNFQLLVQQVLFQYRDFQSSYEFVSSIASESLNAVLPHRRNNCQRLP